MESKEKKTGSFDDELNARNIELKDKRDELLKDGVRVTLNDIVESIESHQDEFTKLMIGKIQTKAIRNLTADILVEATKGRMIVPHFSPSPLKSSPVWVFVGTHWSEVPNPQITRDFICDCCHKMGLDNMFINDDAFIDKLRKQVEHMLSKYPYQERKERVALLNCLNGTLEISADGQPRLRPHRREDYFRYVLPYKYNPQADCPRFRQYLGEVLLETGKGTAVIEYIASCFVPWLHIEKILALLGGGSNGKSVLIRVIEGLFGKEAVSHENMHDLTTNETHRANIERKLVNMATENDGKINDAIFRALASGEPVTCRKYYSQPYEMNEYAKLIFSFNEMPKVKSLLANKRRWMLVKFDVTISEEDADMDLDEKLSAELPGILNMVLEVLPGLLERKKFSKNEALDAALRELEFHNDPVLQFIRMRCETGPSISCKGSELHKALKDYLAENGYSIISNQAFYNRLRELGHEIPQDGHQPTFNIKVVRYED